MASFGQDRQHSERAEGAPRDRVDRAPATPDPVVSHLIALQQSAGNAAVSRLVAGSRVLQRQLDGGAPPAAPAAPATPAPAPATAGGGQDALLGMTRVAWQTGVTQREHDAATALHRPKAGKPELQQATTQLQEAATAADSIGGQFATLDPSRVTRKDVHFNAILGHRREILPLMEKVTPADIGNSIEANLVTSSETAIADIAAPLPAPGAGGAAPAAAPTPAAPAAP